MRCTVLQAWRTTVRRRCPAPRCEGEAVCALCYTLPAPPAPGEANPEYAAKLREVLGRLGFPADYIARVR